MPRLTSEEQLLDPVFRAKIIEEIESTENKSRKHEQFKRYQCYKDKTFLYVVRDLLKQFDQETVNEMQYCTSNIGFVRKIIDKLARVYKYGVTREAQNETDTKKVQALEKELNFNAAMKKINRFFKLHKNTLAYVCPKNESMELNAKKCLKVIPLAPFLYDAVEIADNREKAGCVILSDYESESSQYYSLSASRPQQAVIRYKSESGGDKVDQIIADAPTDQKQYSQNDGKLYIFWSKKYHFTCDSKGGLVAPDTHNPLQELPFVNFSEDQDGCFWAEGGNDLTDGSILSNSLITNVNHIAITQGYGQLVMTGARLPRNQKIGPNKAILLEWEKENDPEPTFEFKTANPPLDQLRSLIEMYVALLLTTNNLSTSGVSSNLNGGSEFPSGIAMMIDKAESMEDVDDQRQIFIDNEPEIWELIAKWQKVLKASGQLSDELSQLMLPEELELKLKFNPPNVIQSEKERLEVLKLKDELGLMTKIDLLRSEYPDLDDEQLLKKLEEIMEEKQEALNESLGNQNNVDGNLEQPGAGPGEPPAEDPDQDKE